MVMKSALLAKLDAGGSIPFRREADELMLGVHAIESGGVNLCTTIVSAYTGQSMPKRGVRAAGLPYRLSLQTVKAIADSTTLVQRIR